MVGNGAEADGMTSRFTQFWEDNAVLRNSVLVYNTGRSLGQFTSLYQEKANALALPNVLITAVGTKVSSQHHSYPFQPTPQARCSAAAITVTSIPDTCRALLLYACTHCCLCHAFAMPFPCQPEQCWSKECVSDCMSLCQLWSDLPIYLSVSRLSVCSLPANLLLTGPVQRKTCSSCSAWHRPEPLGDAADLHAGHGRWLQRACFRPEVA